MLTARISYHISFNKNIRNPPPTHPGSRLEQADSATYSFLTTRLSIASPVHGFFFQQPPSRLYSYNLHFHSMFYYQSSFLHRMGLMGNIPSLTKNSSGSGSCVMFVGRDMAAIPAGKTGNGPSKKVHEGDDDNFCVHAGSKAFNAQATGQHSSSVGMCQLKLGTLLHSQCGNWRLRARLHAALWSGRAYSSTAIHCASRRRTAHAAAQSALAWPQRAQQPSLLPRRGNAPALTPNALQQHTGLHPTSTLRQGSSPAVPCTAGAQQAHSRRTAGPPLMHTKRAQLPSTTCTPALAHGALDNPAAMHCGWGMAHPLHGSLQLPTSPSPPCGGSHGCVHGGGGGGEGRP